MHKPSKDFLEGMEDSLRHLLKVDEGSLVDFEVLKNNKRMFHSGKRPSFAISVTYRDSTNRLLNDHIWAKRIDDPRLVFNKMADVYQKLAPFAMNKHMPVPLYFDSMTGIIFLSRVIGDSLVIRTLKHLIVRPKMAIHKLYRLYHNIGAWLNRYHHVMSTHQEFALSSILSELYTSLEGSSYFKAYEKKSIQMHLNRIQREFDTDVVMEATTPHNDFSLRNIIIGKGQHFTIIDWDAMVHPEFPSSAPIWHDLTTFIVSIQSLIRFYPFISTKNIEILITAFLDGYFKDTATSIGNYIEDIFFIFTLRSFIGLSGDRPLYQIYKKRLSYRFIKFLKTNLLAGKPSVTKIRFP